MCAQACVTTFALCHGQGAAAASPSQMADTLKSHFEPRFTLPLVSTLPWPPTLTFTGKPYIVLSPNKKWKVCLLSSTLPVYLDSIALILALLRKRTPRWQQITAFYFGTA